MERRRKMVRSAFRSNALEGLRPNPACQPVFDAFIAGEIELDELGQKIDAILGIYTDRGPARPTALDDESGQAGPLPPRLWPSE
ncbi:hypothetical protein D7027_21390 [Ochrobactrum intermedium]|nr:hypothetical protein [Brucella intermedia]